MGKELSFRGGEELKYSIFNSYKALFLQPVFSERVVIGAKMPYG